ncbi:hypothetical protein [Mesorhizobium sp. LSHC414A00]|uniref:hypothetical protein n=1 Tax=Mesorhizobium sp. LSHC414A00 TaxID=1287287 RepID=UPI00041215D8|nr:hypothetical protein [Mesorhizobium sp. LSHC414A00]
MNAHARHVTGAKAVSVQTLARQMLAEASGDLNKATDKFVGYLSNFPRLAEEVLRIGARKLINEVPQVERKAETMRVSVGQPFAKAPHRMNDGALRAKERLLKRGGHFKSALLGMPFVINGISKPLSEWVGTEIAAYGETQLMAGATQIRNARFAIAVGNAAGNKKIGFALKEDDVARLREEAMSSSV